MNLEEAYTQLMTLAEPAALAEGRCGPLNEEQQTYARMIREGSLNAQRWIDEWLRLDKRALTPDDLAVHAHRINSGLTMMLGYASLMLSGVGGSTSPGVDAALTAIVSAGEAVHRAVQHCFDALLRDFPDAEAG